LFYPQIARPRLFLARMVHVHRLNSDAAGSCEAVDDQIESAEQTAGEPVHHRHANGGSFVKPTPGCDIHDLARPQELFKDIAATTQPEDAVAGVTVKLVDEKTGSMGDATEGFRFGSGWQEWR
jgi:hypothetical protein